MNLKLRTHLVASSISGNGKWIALSDLFETKLFYLLSVSNRLRSMSHTEVQSTTSTIQPVRLQRLLPTLSEALPDINSTGCGSSAILFTPDSQRLVLASALTDRIIVLELPIISGGEVAESREAEMRVVQTFHGPSTSERVVRPLRSSGNRNGPPAKRLKVNGHANGHHAVSDADEAADDGPNGHVETDESDSDEEGDLNGEASGHALSPNRSQRVEPVDS